MTEYQSKFQQLLRELFQFDCADLDFGVYRIMNHKREVVERFITHDLPQAVSQELVCGALAEQSQVQQELVLKTQEIRDTFGSDALDAEGCLDGNFHNTPLGKQYLEQQARAVGAHSRQALEANIYNHLYTFFSRYYQEGDFISKRRYSKRERYAIPYNGEEVYLYWANHDQYYIKTAEHFTDYYYQAPNGVTVHFKLQTAEVEQDNVKGEKRFFLPRLEETAWDENAGELIIPFEYRPLTGQESITYGQKNRQDTINERAVTEISKRITKAPRALAALEAERRRNAQGDPVSYLEHHLRQYTRRNTSDFFIHKDLRGFLSRELDFYLKNEVLNLEEMETAGEGLTEGWFQMLRLIKAVGDRIIAFLAQIENFQKMLWEKRKFITETFYCITLGQIDESFYPEIAANESQRQEWMRLYGIDELPDFPSPLWGEGRGEGQIKSRHQEQRSALLTSFSREMRHAPTDAEKRLWYFLRDRQMGGYKFRRQHPMGPYIVDFICIEARLIIELDGGQHNTPSGKEYDRERTGWLEEQGFKVLRFWDNDVLKNTEGVLKVILSELEEAPHPNPLPIGEREDAPHPNPLPYEEREVEFLKAHPTLVLDTRCFDTGFVDRLLASFENLDEITDGLLVHGENWQALNLLVENYRMGIQCIHIDPPYNTQTSGFLYKNDYQHSSWLAMMHNRIVAGFDLLDLAGSYICHIDENEYDRLYSVFQMLNSAYLTTIVWDKKNPMMGGKGIAIQHEYIIWCSMYEGQFETKGENVKEMHAKAKQLIGMYGSVIKNCIKDYQDWIKINEKLSGGEKAYKYLESDGRIYRLVAMTWPNPIQPPEQFFIPLIHPITCKPCPVPSRGWSRTPEKMKELIDKNEIVFGVDESTQPQRKIYLTKGSYRPISSIVYNGKKGKIEIERLGLDFNYCHPVSLYEELINGAIIKNKGYVLDYFAGSGTTGHAVINLNREDGGRRKFILVEMADYFNAVLLPRLKKATFTPEWKDGKPKRQATAEEAARGPRIMKVIRLESYEDTLNNIAFEEPSGQLALRFEDYLLQYMLQWETRGSETLLNVEKLAQPFDYQLHIQRDGQTRAQAVDVPETFNYLLGLQVQNRRVYYVPSPQRGEGKGEGRYLVYRGLVDGRQIAVIWRETEGWEQTDYERDKQFVAEHKLSEGADEIYVNGDSFIPGARALEPLFKARMFAEVAP